MRNCLRVLKLCENISLCNDVNDILLHVLKACYEIIEVEKVTIGLVEKEKIFWKYEFNDNGLVNLNSQVEINIQETAIKDVLFLEYYEFEEQNTRLEIIQKLKPSNGAIKSALYNFLTVNGQVIGIIQAVNKKNRNKFTEEDKNFMSSICNFTASNIYRLRAQEKLLVESSRLQGVFEALTDGIMVVDRYGNPVIHNKAIDQLFFADNKSNFALQAYLNFLIRSFNSEKGYNSEVVLFKPHGLVLSNRMVGIRDANGELSEIIVSIRNISEQRELDRKYTQFYAIMLRKLNRVIKKTYIEKNIRVQRKLVIQQKKIMRNLLFLTELKSGPLRIEKENFDIISIFMQVISKYNKRFYRRNIQVDVSGLMSHGVLAGRFDRLRIKECINLIFENAVKILSGGKFIIEANCNNNYLLFDFTFMKPGISDILKIKCLDWQIQIEMINSGESKSLNLEFSFIKHIIRAHKGLVELNFDDPNKAKVTISLPIEL